MIFLLKAATDRCCHMDTQCGKRSVAVRRIKNRLISSPEHAALKQISAHVSGCWTSKLFLFPASHSFHLCGQTQAHEHGETFCRNSSELPAPFLTSTTLRSRNSVQVKLHQPHAHVVLQTSSTVKLQRAACCEPSAHLCFMLCKLQINKGSHV